MKKLIVMPFLLVPIAMMLICCANQPEEPSTLDKAMEEAVADASKASEPGPLPVASDSSPSTPDAPASLPKIGDAPMAVNPPGEPDVEVSVLRNRVSALEKELQLQRVARADANAVAASLQQDEKILVLTPPTTVNQPPAAPAQTSSPPIDGSLAALRARAEERRARLETSSARLQD